MDLTTKETSFPDSSANSGGKAPYVPGLNSTAALVGAGFIVTAVLTLALYVLVILFASSISGGMSDVGWEWCSNILSCLIVYVPAFIVFVFLFKSLPQQKPAGGFKPQVRQIISCSLVFLGSGYLLNILANALLNVLGLGTSSSDSTVTPFYITLIFTVILAPVIEEYLYRHILMEKLLFLGEAAAVVVSALFFGFAHASFSSFPHTFVGGLILAYIYIRTGKMGWNILLHMAHNLFTVCFAYLPTDGSATTILFLFLVASMVYSVVYPFLHKPWRTLPRNITTYPAKEVRKSFMTNIVFWVGILLEIALLTFTLTMSMSS